MNKRSEKEFGEHAAEKRGWHWALILAFVVVLFYVSEVGEYVKKGVDGIASGKPDILIQ